MIAATEKSDKELDESLRLLDKWIMEQEEENVLTENPEYAELLRMIAEGTKQFNQPTAVDEDEWLAVGDYFNNENGKFDELAEQLRKIDEEEEKATESVQSEFQSLNNLQFQITQEVVQEEADLAEINFRKEQRTKEIANHQANIELQEKKQDEADSDQEQELIEILLKILNH